MDKKLKNSQKFDPHEMNKHTIQYKMLLTTQQNSKYLITGQPFYQ